MISSLQPRSSKIRKVLRVSSADLRAAKMTAIKMYSHIIQMKLYVRVCTSIYRHAAESFAVYMFALWLQHHVVSAVPKSDHHAELPDVLDSIHP